MPESVEDEAIGAGLLLLLGPFGRSGSFVLRSRHRVFTRLPPPMGGWRASSGPAELELPAGPEAPAPSALSAPRVYRSGGARLPTCVASGRGRWGGESPATSSEKDLRFKRVVPVMSSGGSPRGLRLR